MILAKLFRNQIFKKLHFGHNPIGLFFLLATIISFKGKSQIDNSNFIFKAKSDSNSNWNIDFQSFSYFQNKEYFGKIADGYTLFGNQISPKITYQPNKKVKIELGTFIRKDFGNNGIKDLQPIFAISIQKDSTQFRFGNLNANLNHQLIEPLYNFEGIIANNLESGIQLTKSKNGNFLDIWVDWQKMIYQNSPFKEEIWSGINWKPAIYIDKNFKIITPIQFTAYHKGGQITIDNRPLKTEFNMALGLEAIWKTEGFFKEISLQNYILGYKEQSNIIRELKSGTAVYLNANFVSKRISTMLSYFYGNGYSSKTGGSLFQSINQFDESSTEKHRKLLIFRLYKDFQIIPNLYLIARFEPYYDFTNKHFEHSEGLFISYKEIFGIGKSKL
jgi:hypothetical protein